MTTVQGQYNREVIGTMYLLYSGYQFTTCNCQLVSLYIAKNELKILPTVCTWIKHYRIQFQL